MLMGLRTFRRRFLLCVFLRNLRLTAVYRYNESALECGIYYSTRLWVPCDFTTERIRETIHLRPNRVTTKNRQ